MTEVAWPLFGHGSAERAFAESAQSGHLHHGWLIEGPSGIGKSLLARRMAASLLGATPTGPRPLDTASADPVVEKLSAGGHPDLKWLCRRPDDKGKVPQDIPVDDVRALNAFFALKAGLGGWRVGVIDSLDELNRFGANAILKTLEEPPARCLLILISHGERDVLPTIRSRCRRLRLDPLTVEDTRAALMQAGAGPAQLDAALDLAEGRPGRGLKLASQSGIGGAHAARSFVRGLPRPGDVAISDLISRGTVDDEAFEAATSALLGWLTQDAVATPGHAVAWLDSARLLSEGRELNMDRAQLMSKLVARVLAAARTG